MAVAYFSDNGDKLLPLRAGSSLVVDASLGTVKSGATSPRALARLHVKGVQIFTIQHLHAKVFAFDRITFVGSTNASSYSENKLIEAAVRSKDSLLIQQIRQFVDTISVNRLSLQDLKQLEAHYVSSVVKDQTNSDNNIPLQHSTLLMELTLEQGGNRVTQVQPPKSVWSTYFEVTDLTHLPVLKLENILAPEKAPYHRPVVKHHHTFSIEISGAELPRPAILEMRRQGPWHYTYKVIRPSSKDFDSKQKMLQSLKNPSRTSGRRWLII